ncbi:MAG: enoyl-CoA hydratase [Pseudomonadota bacterium]
MTNAIVTTNLQGGVFRVVLNRPEKRNALSIAMLDAIQAALNAADTEKNARVIVIAANGPVFSSGHDLKEMTAARQNEDKGQAFFSETMRKCSTMMQTIVNHRLPVIAEVGGTAAAAGCQLVATCDLAVAVDDANFQTPGVNIGLFCSTPMVALSRNVPHKNAMEMLLTGEACSSAKAVEVGLINKSVPIDQLDKTISEYTDRIKAKSSMTLKIGKQAFYRQAEMPLAEAYEYCSQVMVENMLKRDAEEGINAFIEKRQPEWQDN